MFSLTTHPWWRRWFGSRSERAAARFLNRLGYRILTHNYSCSFGEIDLVALDGHCIVFVEVRSTESGRPEQAACTVDSRKEKKLTRLALHYLKSKKLLDQSARFDVLAISWPAERAEPTIEHYKNAFEATDHFQMYS
jgi:putative endonuclease